MERLRQFTRQNYINLETFRKNGIGVKTPVWFAQDEGSLYVTTFPESGKVKRIRRNQKVNIAPCRANGFVTGEWVAALAVEVLNDQVRQKADRLLDRKYGLLKMLLDYRRRRKGEANTILEIKLLE